MILSDLEKKIWVYLAKHGRAEWNRHTNIRPTKKGFNEMLSKGVKLDELSPVEYY